MNLKTVQTEHDYIVAQLFEWVKAFCRTQTDKYSVYADHCSQSRSYRPPEILGSIPDVFAISDDGCSVVVGEAETEKTLLGHHTERQIVAFLKYCKKFHNSYFLLGVPWVVTIRAHTVLKAITEDENCSSVNCSVLNNWELSDAAGVFKTTSIT